MNPSRQRAAASDKDVRPVKRARSEAALAHAASDPYFERTNEDGNQLIPQALLPDLFPRRIVCVDVAISSHVEAHQTENPNVSLAHADAVYMFKSQAFDEGMKLFADMINVDTFHSEFERSAVRCYNVGVRHAQKGEYNDALRWFEQSLLAGEPSTSIPTVLSPLTYHNLGHCFFCLGRNQVALRCYKAALSLAESLGLDDLYLAATKNCIGVITLHQVSALRTGALSYFEESLATLRQHLGAESKEVATVMNNIGRVYFVMGDYLQAFDVYRQALSIRRRVLDKNCIDTAATISNIGQTLHKMGSLDGAMQHYKQFIQLAESKLGSNHRDIVKITKSMAAIHHQRGELTEARALYSKVRETLVRIGGNHHPELPVVLNELGNLCFENHDLDMALKYYDEGLKIELTLYDSCHPHIFVTLTNIAQVHHQLGNYGHAWLFYSDVHGRTLKAHGPKSLEALKALSSMALMRYHMKDYVQALAIYLDVLQVQREVHRSDENQDVASTLHSIGIVLFNQRAFSTAKKCFLDSLRIRQSILGPTHRDVAVLWYNIATVCLAMGDEDDSIKFYNEALKVEMGADGGRDSDLILTLEHLGFVHLQRGELDEAFEHFCRALDIERRTPNADKVAQAKRLNLIGNIQLQLAHVSEMMECYTEASRIYRAIGLDTDALVIAGYNYYCHSKLFPQCAAMA